MKYKGYFGRVEYDEEAEIFFGRVINIDDVITFESESSKEIKQAFRDSVDDYLEFCASWEKSRASLILVNLSSGQRQRCTNEMNYSQPPSG